MRHTLARLVGLTAAAGLLVAPLTAPTAQAAGPGEGTVTVKILDALGRPAVAQLLLVSAAGVSTPIGSGSTPAASYAGDVPVGGYSVVAIGGWGGITCAGIKSCSFTTLTVGAGADVISTPVITVAEGKSTTYTLKMAAPKVVGSGKVGSPLQVQLPAGLSGLASYVALLAAGVPQVAGYSTKPGVTWLRNGRSTGRTGVTYRPTGADSGRKITARVTYPPVLEFLFAQSGFPGGAAVVPGAWTTNAVAVTKVKPKVRVNVPRKVKQGARPDAWVTVTAGRTFVAGVVQVKVGKARPVRAALRSGFAKVRLPKLKPGTYKITTKYLGSGTYRAVTVTKKVRVVK